MPGYLGDGDLGVEVHVLDGVEEGGAFLHGALESLAAGDQAHAAGRKAFQRSMEDGIQLLHAIQDVYLDPAITIA